MCLESENEDGREKVTRLRTKTSRLLCSNTNTHDDTDPTIQENLKNAETF